MMYQYRPANELMNEMIVRVSDKSWIPVDEGNSDYREYLAWVAEGNTPEPWNPEEAN